MIEYKPTQSNDDVFEKNRLIGTTQHEEKLSLTQLWEVIVRTKRLPEGSDVNILYAGVRERLRDLEREVRQHALRVLIDLIPVTQTSTLDEHMRALLPELLSNLGHPAPALRKSALDTLRIYLNHSRNSDQLLQDIISSTIVEDNVLAAFPFLVNSNTSNDTLKLILERLWLETAEPGYRQEVAAKSLARIRCCLGDEKFKKLLGLERFSQLQKICDLYGLPIDYRDADICDGENGNWNEDEDKVILETEITLKTGPAITMKIHEESRPGSREEYGDSEDEASQKMGVIKVLEDDSDPDYYESARRTPRKVRFGGESVKMRTPESDSNQDDSKTTIRITVTDAVSIKTRRSLIPVRITSLPSTPKRESPHLKPRLHKSTPNLSRSSSKSKIPLKKGFKVQKNVTGNEADKVSAKLKQQPSSAEAKKTLTKLTLPLTTKQRKAENILSPTPTHSEIEIMHNLTRSPEIKRNRSPTPQTEAVQSLDESLEAKRNRSPTPQSQSKHSVVEKQITYNSFQVCPKTPNASDEKSEENVMRPDGPMTQTVKKKNVEDEGTAASYSSFKVCPDDGKAQAGKENISNDLLQTPVSLHQPLQISSFSTEDALTLLVKGLRPSVLEQCLGRVASGICKLGAPSGVNLALMIMEKTPAKKLQLEIIEKCFAHRTREGALQILMAAARLLPSGELEVNKMTEFAASALRDRRRRVRHAALETLASLAQLSSNADILDTVNKITETSQDRQYLLRVVRTRLSRRQLPTVEMDGTVRYSTPRDQTEVEWLAGVNLPSSPASSTSSSTPPINYWRHNSRHQENGNITAPLQLTQDDNNGNQQVWAVDSSVFPKTNVPKETKSNGIKLQPIYILQPEAVRLGERGHRRYDRGRSFSPPKPARRPFPDAAATGSAPHNVNMNNAQRQFKLNEGFRKSFSSEQLYCTERPQHHEPYSFSMSSRSSTTSTGSSTRSGIWQKDMRSGIPVPISSETKLRIRTTTSNTVSIGPVIARRSALGSPIHHNPDRLSSKDDLSHEPQPPPSSGSESSGYFTPPPETQQAFVKLDTEEHISESEEVLPGNDGNNNSQDCTDSFNNNSVNVYLDADTVQRNFSPSSVETSEAIDEVKRTVEEESIQKESVVEPNNNWEREERRLLRFSSSSLKEPSFIEFGKIPQITDNGRKSRSEVDLQNFLPDITTGRKTINSAPPLNEDLPVNNNIVITNLEDLPITPIKAMQPVGIETTEAILKLESPQEEVGARRLTKRFARTQSRKSIKSTPRSVRETTPKSSRPSSKPKETLQQALAQMNSNEWEVMIEGLQSLEKLTKQHPDTIESQIHTVCVSLARQIKNLRSQVARTACYTASQLFMTCKRGLDIELEEIAVPLLQRTADTNKFLRADANAALDVMCAQLPTHRVIVIITSRGCTHQNCIVRAASIRLINDMVKRFGADRVFQMQKELKDKILLAGANALTDGSLEARSYGKMVLSRLIGHPQFHRSLLDAVPQSTLRHIAKTLSTIKPQVT